MKSLQDWGIQPQFRDRDVSRGLSWPSKEARIVSCALFTFRTIFSEDSKLDRLGQTAFTAAHGLTEYLCVGGSILDGRLYMFSGQGYDRDRYMGAMGNQLDSDKH